MNDRIGRDNDHLLNKQDEDDLNVPSQRTDVTPGFEEHHGDTLPNRTSDLDDDRTGDLDDRRDDLGNDRSGDSLVAGRVDDPRPGHDDLGDKLDDDLNDGRPGDVLDQEPPVIDSTRHDDGLDDSTPAVVADPPGDGLDQDVTVVDSDRQGTAPAVDQPAASTSLFDHDPDEVRRRWQEVQAGFVDDPRDSVERADSLLDEITTSLRTALETRTTELQGRWKNSDQNDTEELRTALRDYRAMLEQLLTTSSAGTR
ncbi:hypothetical protein [Streptosporangium subroseum]|uniref:hypothetical protein n=1 Tax=Streptosporangium subroseum TaxID=106412 RepID=UPI003093BF5C|nr:hypothetical protein OHB15_31700 [Streptosporangium subroseum]